MSRVSKILFVTAASLLTVGTAFAEDEPAAEPPADATAPTAPDPAMTATVEASAGFSAEAWPMEIISRPLTLRKGMIRAQGDIGVANITVTVPPVPPSTTSTTTSDTAVSLRVGAGYGVNEKLEIGASYALRLSEFEAKGPLSVYGFYSLKSEAKMRLAADASFTYDLGSETFGIGLGAQFQFHLNEKMMVFTPGQQLRIGLDPTNVAITLPIGFGLQATKNIFASVQTSLATIGIEPSGSAFIFADVTPIQVSAFYSPSNKMDFGLSVGATNVGDFADVFVFLATARLFFGTVPGGAAPAPMVAPAATDPAPAEPAMRF